MEEISTDILVIGSGLAGIFSALEAERFGLRVLIIGKFAIGMGTNTSIANGGFSAATSNLSKENHFKDTLEAGKKLNQHPMVKALVENGPDAIERLRGYGVPLVERGIVYWVNRPEHSSQLGGALLTKVLVERLRNSPIQLLPGLTIFDLAAEEGEVQGAFGFLKDGKPCLVRSKAVILATGGAGALYSRNDNQRSILGDGYALALRAGLPLFDLEFVQFFPFVLAESRLHTLMLYPPYPKGIKMFNEKREDLLEPFGIRGDFSRAIMTERDRFSVLLYEASQEGDVFWDLTEVSEGEWEHYPLNFLRKSKFPFRDRPFLVAPAAHFFMGGVEIDDKGRTTLPGLFAAGEVAWGVHGANRLGGNALTECAVFGTLAGRSAAEYIRQREGGQGQSDHPSEALSKRWERKAKVYTKRRRGVFDYPKDLMKDLKDFAWKYAGPVREEGSLKEGLERLDSLEERIERIYPATLRDLLKKRDLENGSLLLKAILNGSLLRMESRGSFFRRDLPKQDDENWLRNTCYRLGKGEFQITHQPPKG